jgi:hypothetical protein
VDAPNIIMTIVTVLLLTIHLHYLRTGILDHKEEK